MQYKSSITIISAATITTDTNMTFKHWVENSLWTLPPTRMTFKHWVDTSQWTLPMTWLLIIYCVICIMVLCSFYELCT